MHRVTSKSTPLFLIIVFIMTLVAFMLIYSAFIAPKAVIGPSVHVSSRLIATATNPSIKNN